MSYAQPIPVDIEDEHERIHLALVEAGRGYYEKPTVALAEAVRCHEAALGLCAAELCARARALQGAVSLHRGDLAGALKLMVEAEGSLQSEEDLTARCEVSALKAQVSFFTGAYSEALHHAETAVTQADAAGDLGLRVRARRATCMVFGNIGVPDLRERVEELLRLSVAYGDPWEEALSHNDLAHYLQEVGDLAGARREIALGLDRASQVRSENSFVTAILHSTQADILLRADRPAEALAESERAIELLGAQGDPNPYILAVTVRAEVQAQMALGELEDAQRSGEGALEWLGDRVPQMRSLILSTLARALREAGRLDAAYDALERAFELERQAFRELSALQLRLERATLEAAAARRESEALRDQADRDWLTGLHNRRFLARQLERLTREGFAGPVSLAVVDLDHFKQVNDRFGHNAGDQVLIRVAELLRAVVRGSDVVVRSGGEEFVVLMPMTGLDAAASCCERIRSAINDVGWDAIADGLTVSASAGVASSGDPADIDGLVRVADHRLYLAKRAGRDRVIAVG